MQNWLLIFVHHIMRSWYGMNQISLRYMSRLMTKPTKWLCAKRRLRSAWASAQSDQSSLSVCRKLGSIATHSAHKGDSAQTGRIWSRSFYWFCHEAALFFSFFLFFFFYYQLFGCEAHHTLFQTLTISCPIIRDIADVLLTENSNNSCTRVYQWSVVISRHDSGYVVGVTS